jgi:hypothetical protein
MSSVVACYRHVEVVEGHEGRENEGSGRVSNTVSGMGSIVEEPRGLHPTQSSPGPVPGVRLAGEGAGVQVRVCLAVALGEVNHLRALAQHAPLQLG